MIPAAAHDSPDRLQVGVLERGAQDPHLVHVLARRDEVAHDARRLFARGVREPPRPVRRLDLHPAVAAELARRARPDQLAASDDRHAVAHELDLRQQVRVEQHRDALATQVLEQPPHGAPPGGVERARRLVEQQQPRAADHRLRDPEPLLHALRHRADTGVGRLGQPDGGEQSLALGGAAVGAGEPLVHAEQLVGAQPIGEAEQLGEIAERPVRLGRAGRSAGDLGGAGGRGHEAAGDLHERRLARAVGTQQPHELALAHLEADPLERLGRAVGLVQIGGLQCGWHHLASCPMALTDTAPPLSWDGTSLRVLDQTRLPARGGRADAQRRRRHRRGDPPARRPGRSADRRRRRLRARDGGRADADDSGAGARRRRARGCPADGAEPRLGGGAHPRRGDRRARRHGRRRTRRGRGDPPRGRGGQRRARPPRRRRARGRARPPGRSR